MSMNWTKEITEEAEVKKPDRYQFITHMRFQDTKEISCNIYPYTYSYLTCLQE